ncbi:MAG: hypothetical protein JJT88_07855 [Gammaproteobacteria bacterium]|nr:hypothetical protein [Gammaproteobacteria bacterium]
MPTNRSALTDDLLWLLLPGFALVGLHGFGRLLPDGAVLAVWLITTALIGLGHFLRLRIRRRAWLAAYVAPSSVLQRWLRGGALALLLRVLLAAALALVLMIGALRLRGSGELLLLLASLPLMAALRWGTERRLSHHVSLHYLPESAWRVTLGLTFLILCAGLLAQAWWRPGPDFSAVTLDQAAWRLALAEQANSALLEQALAMAGAMDGVRWWLAQHGLPRLDWPLLELLGWLLVLLESAVFVWAWLHCCVGVMLMRTLWEPSHAAADAVSTP